MLPSILDKVLRALVPSEADRALGVMPRASSQPQFVNMSIEELRDEIAGYEERTGMSTAEMREGLQLGTVRETQTVCSWLMSVEILEDLLRLRDGESGVGCG